MTEFYFYSQDGLEARTVEELQDIAADKDIEGSSSMVKAELVTAIIVAQNEELAPIIAASSINGDRPLNVVVAELADRVRALSLAALDQRTRPAVQILGSN